MTHDEELEVLAGEYVLGTLPIERRHEVERRCATEPALEAAVARWQARLQPLDTLAAPVTPSPELAHRVERTLDRLANQATPSWTQRLWNNTAWWRFAAAGSFAAALAMGVLLARDTTDAQPPRFLVVLLAPQTQAPGWVIQASNTRQVQLIPLGVVEVPADRALQFWTKADGWNKPVSLGLVKPGQRISIDLDRLPALQPNQLFELTLEPKDGSPTGLPTGPIQAIGRAVEVL